MSSTSTQTESTQASVNPEDQNRWAYIKSPHLPSKHRKNRPTSEEEEEEYLTDDSKERTPPPTPSPDPYALQEEDTDAMLEEDDLSSLPALATELAERRRRRGVLTRDSFEFKALKPDDTAAKKTQDDDQPPDGPVNSPVLPSSASTKPKGVSPARISL
ncbi:MAG: hypothetical protein Q9169_008466 [Polycauliona sp. 2 TL-2023]